MGLLPVPPASPVEGETADHVILCTLRPEDTSVKDYILDGRGPEIPFLEIAGDINGPLIEPGVLEPGQRQVRRESSSLGLEAVCPHDAFHLAVELMENGRWLADAYPEDPRPTGGREEADTTETKSAPSSGGSPGRPTLQRAGGF
jgi:hypothetical protein